MPLQVKLVPTTRQGEDWPCSKCGAANVPVTFFTVFALNGADTTERLCMNCLHDGHEVSALIEPPDLSPGRRPPSKRLVKRTRKEEYQLATDAGGRRQVASGALPGLKGDGYLKGVVRWDSKMCFSKQPSWTLDDLDKIRGEAAYGEVPAIITTFADKHTHQIRERWVTIPYEVYEEKIVHAARNHK